MRKLKLQMQISLDGYVAGPNGEMDWMIMNWDDALNNYVMQISEPIDTILLGRKLAEGFIDTWKGINDNPESANKFSQIMNDSHKIVFSRTITSHQWANTSVTNNNLVSEVNKLKNQNGGDMIAYGGGNFASQLIQHNLIDEYHLFINPVMLGGGMPIMDKLAERLLLNHVESKGFSYGITLVSYIPSQSNNLSKI